MNYADRKAERIARYEDRADNAEARAAQLLKAGQEALDAIPFGQPILVGHYSEKGDRAYRARTFATIDRGFAESAKAEHYRDKAAAAMNNHAISSDDEEAISKVQTRIEKLEAQQATMKAANRICQAKPKNESTPEKIAALEALGLPDPGRLFTPDFCGRIGFPSYALTNNNGNIRRLRERLSDLERIAAQRAEAPEAIEHQHDGFTIREDADENRVQIIFPGKPNEATRTLLKSHGFRWAPSVGAWQRQLNNAGRYAAQYVAERLEA
ncbi:MAG: DUF3560 domain-containing protein [Armatimonadota bacterium]